MNEAQAQRVRAIFDLYLERKSIGAVVGELNERGWTIKQWRTRKEKIYGGGRFTKSSLHEQLTNVACVGKVKYTTFKLNCVNKIISHEAHSDHGARLHLLSMIAVSP